MAKRFRSRLYYIERIGRRDGNLRYITNEDGTLYAGNQKTKIKPEDLPEWYIYGRYYKCFGYMSAKGITDMVYLPSRFSNHFLKDDCLQVLTICKRTHSDARAPSRDYDGFEGIARKGLFLDARERRRQRPGDEITHSDFH